tara:strand:+ start:221 stop:559 length:339 start_codon:yes stop_codon:yes gene_type:complete
MSVSAPAVAYEKKNRIAYITLNRPEVLNALNNELRQRLQEVINDFSYDPEMLVGIVRGAGGRASCASLTWPRRARSRALSFIPWTACTALKMRGMSGGCSRCFSASRTPGWR